MESKQNGTDEFIYNRNRFTDGGKKKKNKLIITGGWGKREGIL